MKKISKADQTERDSLVTDLRAAAETLDEEWGHIELAITSYNEKINAYNTVLEQARDWQNGIVASIDEYIGDKSEKWQEGDAGEAYRSWRDSVEGEQLDDIEELDMPTKPEPEHADALEGMPEGVEPT